MKELLERIVSGHDLREEEAADLLVALTDESLPEAAAAAMLTALRAKGETADEVRGFATAMRRLARRPNIPRDASAVDIVGTGGDGSGSLNLSTGAALLTAATGQPVVKHGNRSISSRCGSADVLEALGLRLPTDESEAGACLDATGFTFLFAPYFHPAMKALAAVRRTIGIRTIFNVLGPLTNPAEPPYYLIGAFSVEVAELMADALSGLPLERAFVVHGTPGWDEATPVGPFELFDVRPGSVSHTQRDPAVFGVPRCAPEDLAGGDAAANASRLRSALQGEDGPHRHAITIGSALALEVSGRVPGFERGLEAARGAIDDGSGAAFLERLIAFSAGGEDSND